MFACRTLHHFILILIFLPSNQKCLQAFAHLLQVSIPSFQGITIHFHPHGITLSFWLQRCPMLELSELSRAWQMQHLTYEVYQGIQHLRIYEQHLIQSGLIKFDIQMRREFIVHLQKCCKAWRYRLKCTFQGTWPHWIVFTAVPHFPALELGPRFGPLFTTLTEPPRLPMSPVFVNPDISLKEF